MTEKEHDPLCVDRGMGELSTWECTCDTIRNIRADERRLIKDVVIDVYDDHLYVFGQRPHVTALLRKITEMGNYAD